MAFSPDPSDCTETPSCHGTGMIMTWKNRITGETKPITVINKGEAQKMFSEIELLPAKERADWYEWYTTCPCQEKKQAKKRQEELLASSRITKRFQQRTLERFRILDPANFPEEKRKAVAALAIDQQAALEIVTAYCENYEQHAEQGQGFGLIGDPGTGKSHLLGAKTNCLLAKGIQSVFVNTSEIFDEIRRCFQKDEAGKYIQDRSSEILDLLKNAADLGLDDLGTERPTDWVLEQLYIIINYRWDNFLPISFTSNLTADEMIQQLGRKIYRRLVEPNLGRLKTIKGPSFEQLIMQEGKE